MRLGFLLGIISLAKGYVRVEKGGSVLGRCWVEVWLSFMDKLGAAIVTERRIRSAFMTAYFRYQRHCWSS